MDDPKETLIIDPKSQAIGMKEAFYCGNCESIVNRSKKCPHCACETALQRLDAMLGATTSIPASQAHYCLACDRFLGPGGECTNCRSTLIVPVQQVATSKQDKRVMGMLELLDETLAVRA